MKKTEAFVIALLFSLFLVVPFAFTVFSPKASFSQWENRNLSSFPEVTGEEVLSGEFGKKFETYFSDHFMMREKFVKVKRQINAALGMREENGIIIGESALFSLPDFSLTEKIMNSVDAINTFAKKTDANVSLMLVPSSAALFPEELPRFAPKASERETISEIYSQLIGVRGIDVSSALQTEAFEKVFYKTDHHWTSFGASLAWREFSGKDTSFEFEEVSDSFQGTYSSRMGQIFHKNDVIEKCTSGDAFKNVSIFNGEKVENFTSMYFEDYLLKKDKYSYFLGQNELVVTLNTENTNGRVLLMFKDSYAHSFVQCAGGEYERVILVDMRYVNKPLSLVLAEAGVDIKDVTDVLFLYSTDTFKDLNNLFMIN